MLMNVRMETGLVLGSIAVDARVWRHPRAGMHLDAHAPVSVNEESPPLSHEAVTPRPVLVMRMPVREWVLPGGRVEHAFHVDDASHAEAFSGMNFEYSVLAVRNAAATYLLPSWAMDHVVSPLAFGVVLEEQVARGRCPSAWEYMLLMHPSLEAGVRAAWNTRLLSINMGAGGVEITDIRMYDYAVTDVQLAEMTAVAPSLEERVHQMAAERAARHLENTLLFGASIEEARTNHGTQTGRFSGAGANHSSGPKAEGPPPTTRAYSTVRRALEL